MYILKKIFLTDNVKNTSAIVEPYDEDLIDVNYLKKSNKICFSEKLKIALFIVSFFALSNTFAQRDVITTQAGEAIRCKILEETPSRFIYAYLGNSGKVLRNEIFKNLVTEFKYNVYSSDLVDSKGRPLPISKDKVIITTESKPTTTDKNAGQSQNKRTNSETKQANGNVSSQSKSTTVVTNKAQTTTSSETKTGGATTKTETKQTTGGFATTTTNNGAVKSTKKEQKVVSTSSSSSSSSSNVQKSQTNNKPVVRTDSDSPQAEKPVDEQELAKSQAEGKTQNSTTSSPLKAYPTENTTRFRVGVRGGFAGLLSKTALTDEYSKYKQGLESGWMFGVDAAYFPVHNFGFGLMYSNFQAKNSSNSIKYTSLIDPTKKDITGAISDKTSTKFIGVPFYYRKNIDYKTFFIVGVAPGMNYYSDARTEGTASLTRKGQQFGVAATAGVDFLLGNDIIGRDIILSLEGGYNYAKFNKLDYGAGALTLATPLDQSHWSITVGLRFTRYPKYLRLTSY